MEAQNKDWARLKSGELMLQASQIMLPGAGIDGKPSSIDSVSLRPCCTLVPIASSASVLPVNLPPPPPPVVQRVCKFPSFACKTHFRRASRHMLNQLSL